MKQTQASRADSRREQSPEHQVDLTLIENELHLPSGGVFLTDPNLYEDLNIPTRIEHGIEKIGGAAVELTVEIPEEILDPHPLLFAHGYCGPQEAYAKVRKATARNGKIGITYGTPRTQENYASLHPTHLGNPTRLLAQAAWAAMRGSRKMSDKVGIDLSQVRYDLSGHSMGGGSAVRVAKRHKDLVRSVILNESAGLEPHNTIMMLGRLGGFARNELKESRDAALLLKSILHVMRNPVKLVAEGIAVSNCDIRKDVSQLGNMGIKTAAIFGLGDSLISAEKSFAHSDDIPDFFALYDDPRAHHLWPQTNPFEVAMAHKQMLERMHSSKSTKPHLVAA